MTAEYALAFHLLYLGVSGDKMGRNQGFFLGLFAGLSIFSSTSFGSDFMPEARHYEAASQGRDCAIYRSLATKARLTIEQYQDAELHFSELLKVRRADLTRCADSRAVDMDGSDESEELAAESCPALYQQWIETGFRLRALRQDSESTRSSIVLLNTNLDRFCARRPK